jgi:hypothetical protein
MGEPMKGVAVAAWDPIVSLQVLTTPPYQFGITIPSIIRLGLYLLTAFGNAVSGSHISSDSISIDVERPDSPQRIATNCTQLDESVGDESVIRVTGTCTDGAVVDLSKSTQTIYQTTPSGIVSVSRDGVVVALAAGAATILVENKQRTAAIRVFVTPAPR